MQTRHGQLPKPYRRGREKGRSSYAVRVRPRHEKMAAMMLEHKGYESADIPFACKEQGKYRSGSMLPFSRRQSKSSIRLTPSCWLRSLFEFLQAPLHVLSGHDFGLLGQDPGDDFPFLRRDLSLTDGRHDAHHP